MPGRAVRAAGARALAFDILRRVERRGAFASILLQRLERDVPAREVSLATELVYGCLRFRLRDEHVLASLAGRSLAAIGPDLALLFRIAAHQILRLDRIPERAAVHEAVEMARSLPGRGGGAVSGSAAARREGGARFLNALLRRLCREKGSLPPPEGPEAEALSIRESHPEWIVRRWIGRFGLEGARALLAADNRPAPLSVRVDPARASVEEAAASLASEGVTTSRSRILPDFLRVLEGSPQRTRAFSEGWIYIQDEASGLVPHLLAVTPGTRILDACAAPGGKALALARMAGDRGIVVAADVHPSRLRLLAANARRLRVENVRLAACDAATPPFAPPPAGLFDAVLVDAPCSGSGVFRRDVESRYRLAPEDLPRLAAAQLAVLEGAAPLVKAGGRVVYSVCSLEPEEGPEVVAGFLERHPEFRSVDLRASPPAPFGPDALRLLTPDGVLLTLPHRDDLDGFYAAALVRR